VDTAFVVKDFVRAVSTPPRETTSMLPFVRITDDTGKTFRYVNIEATPEEARKIAGAISRLVERAGLPPTVQITLGADDVDAGTPLTHARETRPSRASRGR
jgi:hypothetical protein